MGNIMKRRLLNTTPPTHPHFPLLLLFASGHRHCYHLYMNQWNEFNHPRPIASSWILSLKLLLLLLLLLLLVGEMIFARARECRYWSLFVCMYVGMYVQYSDRERARAREREGFVFCRPCGHGFNPLHSTAVASTEIRDMYGVIESEKIGFPTQDVVLAV